MAKPRAILKRRKAVQNIAKITRTMQLIATAKFKRAMDRAIAARPYTDRLTHLIASLSGAAGAFEHPLLEARDAKHVAVLAVASNRGLCGGYNSGVSRALLRLQEEIKARDLTQELHVVGKKIYNQLLFQGVQVDDHHTHIEDRPTFEEVDGVLTPLVERYIAGEIDELHVVYTKFETAARQRPSAERVLPLDQPEAGGAQRDYEYHPDAETLLSSLLPRSVRLHVFQAFLDAAVSEQVARMVAMKSATDNASEMISDLTMLYNRSRQTLITTELSEIIGGVAALE